MSTPVSDIFVCSGVRLSPTYEHTIHFADKDAQLSYFMGKVVKTFSNYTYLRKEWSIKVEADMREAGSWNYLYFWNPTPYVGDLKNYFYFITKVEYINDRTVELFLEMDVMQTFLFDFNLNQCFVDREHSATDFYAEHLEEEGLDLGYYVNRSVNDDTLLDELCILVMSTVDLMSAQLDDNGKEVYADYYGTKIDGVFSGAGLWACEVNKWGGLVSILRSMDKAGVSDGVISIYMYPKELVTLATGSSWDDNDQMKPVYGINKNKLSTQFLSPTSLAGNYTPKNQKLLHYPYTYLYVTNNQGGSAIFPYEKFATENENGRRVAKFKYGGTVLPEGSVCLTPYDYDGMLSNFESSLSITNFPVCSWNQDTYKLWLAQNQNSQQLAMAESVVKIGVGVATAGVSVASGNLLGAGGGLAAAYSGVSQISGLLAQKKDAEIQPLQSKGNISGTINTAMGEKHFTFIQKSVDSATATRLDNYFTMYGYKTNRVKVPNRNVRTAFTYTKTIGCNAYGNIGMEYIRQINSIFDNGITFWRDGDKIGDYSQSNNCMG